MGQAILACGRDAEEQRAADEGARWLVGFYGSTPAYEPVLATEGRADLHPELRRLSREGRWDEMAALVDDDLLEAVVVRGDPDRVATRLLARTSGQVDRLAVYAPGGIADEALAAVVAGVRARRPRPGLIAGGQARRRSTITPRRPVTASRGARRHVVPGTS